jgi:hypothetical protein
MGEDVVDQKNKARKCCTFSSFKKHGVFVSKRGNTLLRNPLLVHTTAGLMTIMQLNQISDLLYI